MDADFRDAKKQERAADDLLMRLEEEANSNASAARINQLQEEVATAVTMLRQKVRHATPLLSPRIYCWAGGMQVDAIEGALRDTPPTLRDAQSERRASQLQEKLRMLESGLSRFVGRLGAQQREADERCEKARAGCPVCIDILMAWYCVL